MVGIKITLDAKKFQDRLEQIATQLDVKTKKALQVIVYDFIFAKSQQYVPNRINKPFGGFLESSGIVEDISKGKRLGFDITYEADYAAIVHAMPDTYNYTKPGSGPRYLQRAVDETIGKVKGIIVEELKKELFK